MLPRQGPWSVIRQGSSMITAWWPMPALLLPASFAKHLGFSQLVQQFAINLGDAPGRSNTGDKIMTLVASALAGGDCIDDADAMRAIGIGRCSQPACSRCQS